MLKNMLFEETMREIWQVGYYFAWRQISNASYMFTCSARILDKKWDGSVAVCLTTNLMASDSTSILSDVLRIG